MKSLLTIFALVATTSLANAGTLYFAPTGSPGGTGTWDASTTASWSLNADGSGTLVNWNNAAGGDVAVLSGATGSAPIISLGSNVSVNQIQHTRGSGSISGAFTINFGGSANYSGGGSLVLQNSGISVGNSGFNMTGGVLQLGSNPAGATPGTGGTLSFSGSSSDVNVNGGELRVTNSGALPSTTRLNLSNNGNFSILAGTASIAGLDSTNTSINSRIDRNGSPGISVGLSLSRASGTSTFYGAFIDTTDSINLTKGGDYTQIIAGSVASTAAGTSSIQGGVLALAKSGNLNATLSTGAITISGGELRLDAANQIGNSQAINLTGGTFNANGLSENAGILSLNGNSTINFGSGTSILDFNSFNWTAGTLTINNWTSGFDQLLFGADPTANIGQFSFTGYSGASVVDIGGGLYEVTAVPEPSSAVLAALFLVGVILLRRRRSVSSH